MQDYIEFARKNGVVLSEYGKCQCCGAQVKKGIHECLEIVNAGFPVIDFSKPKNHFYRFLMVDAHALQHPEIHGRWSNHFHLTRLHLIFNYDVDWSYALSPKLSDHLNMYKRDKQDEHLVPPKVLERGVITTSDIREKSNDENACKQLIVEWAKEVHVVWRDSHSIVDAIAQRFL